MAGRDAARTREAARFAGHDVMPVIYDEVPGNLSHVLVAVSDAAITNVAAVIAERANPRVALHTCGAAGPEALHPLRSCGTACGALHPLQTLTGDEESAAALRGASFGMCGDDEALNWAQHIVNLAQGTALPVNSESMPLYHAAAVMASNSVLALMDASRELFELAGIESQRALSASAPLLRASIENGLRLGPVDALTGPVARGDVETLQAHRQALERAPESVRNLYLASARQALTIARRKGLVFESAMQIEERLGQC